jgi:hypothetical protein
MKVMSVWQWQRNINGINGNNLMAIIISENMYQWLISEMWRRNINNGVINNGESNRNGSESVA